MRRGVAVVVVVVVVECVFSLSAVLVLYRVCGEFYESKEAKGVERESRENGLTKYRKTHLRTYFIL
ncbi:unnamed protein product [Ectocarpus sp. 6 AP-2014]